MCSMDFKDSGMFAKCLQNVGCTLYGIWKVQAVYFTIWVNIFGPHLYYW